MGKLNVTTQLLLSFMWEDEMPCACVPDHPLTEEDKMLENDNPTMSYPNVWSEATPETAPNLILTGKKTVGDLVPSHLIDQLAPFHHVLDFGCGVGRNTFPLWDKLHEVTAFDFPNMIEMLKSDPRYVQANTKSIHVATEWGQIQGKKYDAIIACLVLQHLPVAVLHTYLEGLSKMAPIMFVHSRAYLDYDGGLVIDSILRYFDYMRGAACSGDYIVRGMSDNEISKVMQARGEQHYTAWFTPL